MLEVILIVLSWTFAVWCLCRLSEAEKRCHYFERNAAKWFEEYHDCERELRTIRECIEDGDFWKLN